MRIVRFALLLASLPASQAPVPQAAGPADAVSGTDPASGIQYALVTLEGKTVPAGQPAPRITAQCTRTSAGKLNFELLADAGDVPGLKYIPPFRATAEQPFPPRTPVASVTMEYLGYTKVKPMRRVWAEIDGLPGEWMYTAPGLGSHNIDPISVTMRYLKALPTLRLTWPAQSGKASVTWEFETAAWQLRVKAEPLCAASGL